MAAMGVLFDLRPSEIRSVPQNSGYCYYVTGVSLVDPVSAAGQGEVNVIIEAEDEAFAIIGTLSAEAPFAAVQPEVLVGGELFLRHDGVAATVRFHGRVLEEDYCLSAVVRDVEEEVVPSVVDYNHRRDFDDEALEALLDYYENEGLPGAVPDNGEEEQDVLDYDVEEVVAVLDNGEEGVTDDDEEERQPKRRKITGDE
ncbi:hypothetical protein EJB05_09459, partial [Eragrostis curvula]